MRLYYFVNEGIGESRVHEAMCTLNSAHSFHIGSRGAGRTRTACGKTMQPCVSSRKRPSFPISSTNVTCNLICIKYRPFCGPSRAGFVRKPVTHPPYPAASARGLVNTFRGDDGECFLSGSRPQSLIYFWLRICILDGRNKLRKIARDRPRGMGKSSRRVSVEARDNLSDQRSTQFKKRGILLLFFFCINKKSFEFSYLPLHE